jgi:rhamnose transport system ATP-binding protein
VSPAAPPLLEMRGIAKAFPGVQALDDVSLVLRPGRVTALIGENGAGKSTLVKILTGIYAPDRGEIRIDGAPVTLPTARAAQDSGITAIHQETVLFDELSVAENIFLGHSPRGRFGTIDWKAMRERSRAILASIHSTIDPTIPLKQLSIAQRHLVAVARALSVEARIVIMDEPTAALSHKEVEDLFRIIRTLQGQGKAILFISHKFDEVYGIADDFVVFRDGRLVGEGPLEATSRADLVRMMVGRTVDQVFPKVSVPIGAAVLSVEGLGHPTEFADISFTLRRGEILGFYGLVGAGRSELMQAIFGITRPSHGRIVLDGTPIFQNISLPSLARTARNGFLDAARELALARAYAERLDLRASALDQPVGTLSGGNQQKVVIGKWLATRPKVIILDEPTKGIDVGSKAAVHAFMGELARDGLAVLMVSSEIPEILGMADRVVVMREGRIAGTFEREGLTAETLVACATGNLAAAA